MEGFVKALISGVLVMIFGVVVMFIKWVRGDYDEKNIKAIIDEVNDEIRSEEKGKLVAINEEIKAYPNDPISYFTRGKVKSNLEDYDSALADFNKAIDLDPNNAFYYFYRGVAKWELKNKNGAETDFNEAIANFDEAMKVNPNFANNYKYRGLAKKYLGLQLAACNDWQKAADFGDEDAAKWVRDECN